MKKINFYSNVNVIIDNAIKATKAEINHLFFIPEGTTNYSGQPDAHRYGYNSIDNKCYDLGFTDVIPDLDNTFIKNFIYSGIHIAKKGNALFDVNCELYCDTKID